MIDPKKRTNQIPISNDQTLCVRKFENHIIIRVTSGNSTHGNSDAIEKIPGRIQTNKITIAINAMANSTTGYVVAAMNLFLNE